MCTRAAGEHLAGVFQFILLWSALVLVRGAVCVDGGEAMDVYMHVVGSL